MDGIEQLSPSERAELEKALKAMEDDPRKVVIGADRLKAMNKRVGDRIGVYSFLTVFGVIYVLPLIVIIANSFRPLPEIVQNGLIGFPHSLSFSAWARAWDSYCVGGTCEGVGPNFINSLELTIPATIISTLLGALNGYVHSDSMPPMP